MSGSDAPERRDTTKVKVDGEEAVLHITDQSVMFEKGGRVSGFLRSAIQMVKQDGDAMVIAYSAGNEVKSVRVEPMIAVAHLLVSGIGGSYARIPSIGLDEVFEELYKETRKELEERLSKVQTEPENKSIRLTPEEDSRYSDVSRQLENIIGVKYGFDPRAEDTPISFWGLEKRPYEIQLAVVKSRHLRFLRLITDSTAEKSDVVFSTDEVWPEDWPRILDRFHLESGPYASDAFTKYVNYLKSHWKYRPTERKPVLAR